MSPVRGAPLLRSSLFGSTRTAKNSEKQQKTARCFAVLLWPNQPATQDFRGEREVVRCKFSARTAKTARTAVGVT
jgi:hypothetical protein